MPAELFSSLILRYKEDSDYRTLADNLKINPLRFERLINEHDSCHYTVHTNVEMFIAF